MIVLESTIDKSLNILNNGKIVSVKAVARVGEEALGFSESMVMGVAGTAPALVLPRQPDTDRSCRRLLGGESFGTADSLCLALLSLHASKPVITMQALLCLGRSVFHPRSILQMALLVARRLHGIRNHPSRDSHLDSHGPHLLITLAQ